MQDLSLHILDIAENAVRAGAQTVTVRLSSDLDNDRITLCIEDDGKGMDGDMLDQAHDPFFTTKTGKRFGLGLALLSQAAVQAGGHLDIESRPGEGTKVTALFQASHPDTKPLGSLVESFAALMAGNPTVRFIFECDAGETQLHFDSEK